MKPRVSFALWTASLYAAVPTPAYAVELRLTEPRPTLIGTGTVFQAELTGAVGAAEIRWDFGDGSSTEFSATGVTAEHTYAAPGHYPVIVVARDDAGFTSQSFQHTVHTSPQPVLSRSSSSMIVDEERGLVMTANSDNGTVTIVDATTLQKIAEVEVFSNPVALALAPDGLLWVVHQDDYAVAIVDVEARKAIDFFRLPYASQPVGIVFSPQGDAFVPLMAVGEVVRIDGVSRDMTARRAVAPFVRGLTVSGDGSSLWVTRFISRGQRGEVYRLDAETLETVARYDLSEDTTTEDGDAKARGLPNYMFSVAVTPDGTRAWVPGKKDNMLRGLERDGLPLTQDTAVRPLVSILNLETNQELLEQRIDLDDRNLPRQVTFTPLGDWAFVSVFGSNLVELRDGFDRSFITALRGDNLLGPVATVLGPNERLIVFADLARKLIVYDVADLLSGVDQITQLVAEVPLVAEEKLRSDVLRGKQVFANAEDLRMASEGYLSCASCHLDGYEDGLVWDFFDRGEGYRNTISLLGRRGTGHGRVHWSANFDEIQDFDGPIRVHQGGLGFIPLEEYETGTRRDPLGEPKAGIDPDLDALAAYVASLDRIPRSPFRNSDGTLTEDGAAGREVFLRLGCGTCHAGEDFTDSALGNLHDVGTLNELSGSRLGGQLTGIDTPTLLGIWQTAPYLHDGSAPTLRDVLTTRNPQGRHGDTSALSPEELDQLVAYLEQLDQGLRPDELRLPMTEPTIPMDGSGGEDGTGGAGPVAAVPAAGGTLATPPTESTSTPPSMTSAVEAPSGAPSVSSGCACEFSSSSSSTAEVWALLATCLAFLRRRMLAVAFGVGSVGCAGNDANDEPSAAGASSVAAAGASGAASSPTQGTAMAGDGSAAGATPEREGNESDGPTALVGNGGAGGRSPPSASGAEAGGAGSGNASSADAGGAAAGQVAFEPSEAIYSVALSVNTAGVTETIGLRNASGSLVTVSDLTISGADAGNFLLLEAPALPTTIAAGALLELTVRFQPPANAPTSNFSAVVSAAVSGESTTDLTASLGLFGLAMSASNAEATLAQVLRTLGIAVDVGSTTLTLGTGSNLVGEELAVRRFVKADAAAPVRLEPVARYSPFEAANYGYYTGGAAAPTLNRLGTMSRGPADNVANRTLYPPLDPDAMLSFDPGSDAFGVFAESQANVASLGGDGRFYQEDALNDDQANVQPVHRIRVFPMKNRGGEIVASSFLLVCEEAQNSDYQDYVFAISNVAPVSD
jgi:YVTN family beta-propeller protein